LFAGIGGVGHYLAEPPNPASTIIICHAGITSATLYVCSPGGSPDNPHARLPALTGLTHHSPALRELQLLISGRSAYEAVTEAMGGVQQLDSLQELTLQFVVSSTPKKGMWPMFFSDNMQLGKLRRLVVQGSSMPGLAVSVSAAAAVRCCRNACVVKQPAAAHTIMYRSSSSSSMYSSSWWLTVAVRACRNAANDQAAA
jgi:hypothetical protein